MAPVYRVYLLNCSLFSGFYSIQHLFVSLIDFIFFAASGRLAEVSDSASFRPDSVKRRDWTPREEDWENPTLDNRLSRKNNRNRPFSGILPPIIHSLNLLCK